MKKNHINFSKKITSWIGSTNSLIVHTIFFIVIFSLRFFGVDASDILLILTTIVSLEAIYLAIFIQITINQHSEDLEEVSEDIEELQENVEGISEDVEEIQKDVEDISDNVEEIQEDVEGIEKDVEEISEDMEEIQKDVDDISEDVEEIQKDVEEISEEEEDAIEENEEKDRFQKIEKSLEILLQEINNLKNTNKKKVPKNTNKKINKKSGK